MTWLTKSITFRISFLFTALAALVFIVMGYVITAAVKHHFDQQDEGILKGKLELIQNILDEPGSNKSVNLSRKLADALVGHHELAVMVTGANKRILFASTNADFLATHMQDAALYSQDASLIVRSLVDGEEHYRCIIVRLAQRSSAPAFGVAIAVNIESHAEFLNMFTSMLLLIGVSGIFIMAVLGWVATNRGLMPVREMTQVAEGINALQLRERLIQNRLPLELRSLAMAFNEMLDRLEDALNRLSGYASDIAHELRTPINNLMLQTQVSLSKKRGENEYREILYSNLEEYERLAHMISDMLFLAKAENGLMVPCIETISLAEEITALFEFYEALASERQVQMKLNGSGVIHGDRLMMRRAISNLLSNAIRHSPPGGQVDIVIGEEKSRLKIAVINKGSPIPDEHIHRIFDRFYRVDASRLHTDEGAGLGLAITRSIIEAHQGAISVKSDIDSTMFSVMLPASMFQVSSK